MTTAIGLAVVLLAALLQVSVLPEFTVFGAHPNLVIVLLAAWITVRTEREALLLVPAAGFALGLLDSQPLGLAMLALSPMILMSGVHSMRLVHSDIVPAIAFTLAATLVYETSILLTLLVSGERPDWLASLLDVLVPASIANVLLLLPVYGLVRLASPDIRRRPAH